MHASAVARSRTTVTAALVRRPGLAATKIRVTSPPIWVGRKFVVNMPIRYARTAAHRVESTPAAARKICHRTPPTTNEASRARAARTNQPQLPPERRLRIRPKSICVATAASRPMLTTARTQNEPASLRRRSKTATITLAPGRVVVAGAPTPPDWVVAEHAYEHYVVDEPAGIAIALLASGGRDSPRCRQEAQRVPRTSSGAPDPAGAFLYSIRRAASSVGRAWDS